MSQIEEITQNSDEMPEVYSGAFTVSEKVEKLVDVAKQQESSREILATSSKQSPNSLTRDVNNKSKSAELTRSSKAKCKCIHQSPRICYGDIGDVDVVQETSKHEGLPHIVETIIPEEIEQCVSSKVFDFNSNELPSNMDKCKKFWNKILENSLNIKPCKQNSKKSTKPKTKDTKPENDDELWIKSYEQLKRQNFDKVKLGKNNKCNVWKLHEFSSEDPMASIQEKEDIRMLSFWRPAKNYTLDRKTARRLSVKIMEKYFVSDTSISIVSNKSSSRLKDMKKESEKRIKNISKTDLEEYYDQEHATSPEQKENTLEPLPYEPPTTPRPRRVSIKPTVEEDIIKEPSVGVESKESDTKLSMSSRLIRRVSIKTDKLLMKDEDDDDNINKVGLTCKCGCEVEDCTCQSIAEEADEELSCEEEESLGSEKCGCNCGVSGCLCKTLPEPKIVCICGCNVEDCVCEGERIKTKKDCHCGCNLEDCICDKLDFKRDCSCGCGFDECICQTIKLGKDECFCGCGIEDCMCESPFKKCACGFDDCKCYEIARLADFVKEFENEKMKKRVKQKKFVDMAIQCGQILIKSSGDKEENEDDKKKQNKKENVYCAICGHYNCLCKVEIHHQ